MLRGITTNELKKGMTLMFRSQLHDILDFAHIKPGKGGAFVKVKFKNLNTQSIFEHTFNSKEKVEQAIIEKKSLEYIYRDGNNLVFMDNETYEQFPYDVKLLGDGVKWLKDNTPVTILEFDGSVINIELPAHASFKVTAAEPAVKGDTATNVTKMVTLETGVEVRVPSFIKEGDTLRIDTRTGEYIERDNS